MEMDWQEKYNINKQYTKNRQESWDTFDDFQKTGNGRLGQIDVEKHHIDLITPEIRPINSALTALHRKQAN